MRIKHLWAKIMEEWGYGATRIYNPPFDMLPLVVHKTEQESGTEINLTPKWPDQPCTRSWWN